MPLPCKNPKYRYKGEVRLAFCNNKIVEVKPKEIILMENKLHKKIFKGKEGGLYYKKGKIKHYVSQ